MPRRATAAAAVSGVPTASTSMSGAEVAGNFRISSREAGALAGGVGGRCRIGSSAAAEGRARGVVLPCSAGEADGEMRGTLPPALVTAETRGGFGEDVSVSVAGDDFADGTGERAVGSA